MDVLIIQRKPTTSRRQRPQFGRLHIRSHTEAYFRLQKPAGQDVTQESEIILPVSKSSLLWVFAIHLTD